MNSPTLHPLLAAGLGLVAALSARPAAAAQVGAPPLARAGVALEATALELVGVPASTYPHFRFVRVVQETRPVWIAIDPTRHPELIGLPGDVYVVAARDQAGWQADATLVDLRGGPTPILVQAGSIQANRVQIDTGTLAGFAGPDLGVGYDVVVDYDGDARLGPGDVIDGAGDRTGFWVVRDTTQPGPYAVTETTYSGGSFLGQDTYYPTNIAGLGKLPLVVISHGNGHQYTWYDHIGEHLASWGCVVMSHQNNTSPGPEAASLTTLSNTEYLLANQAAIDGGVLLGHIDEQRICWIGHSRGGEGVVRAYNKLATGAYTPVQFTLESVRLVSSIAPTQFLASGSIDPRGVGYHMFVGASDTDVTGGPSNPIAQSLPIFERAAGEKLCTILQGAGHADFHTAATQCWCAGPNLIGKAGTHAVQKAYYLPLVKRFCEGSEPARDYLERAFDDMDVLGIPAGVVAANEYHTARAGPRVVVDDFQTAPDPFVASSGAAVTFDVQGLQEGLMSDLDGSFVFSASTPFNGMTRRRDSGDDPRCAVLNWDLFLPSYYEYDLRPGAGDLSGLEWLSFRACQGTRHAMTDLLDGPLSFGVSLIDDAGHQSTIEFGEYGRITRTYPRGGAGTGAGWANEMVTVRMRLTDFTHDNPALDLARVDRLRFLFEFDVGSPVGRIGLDDVEFLPEGD